MNLTEQWDKGELPEGDYYIKRRNGDTLYDNIDSHGVWRNSIDEDIVEVLAEMPDYVEWRNMVSCACEEHEENNRLIEENAKLKERNDSLNNRDINLCRIANGIRDENFALKELLKRVVNATDFYHGIKTASVVDYGVWYNIANEISQVLGEK